MSDYNCREYIYTYYPDSKIKELRTVCSVLLGLLITFLCLDLFGICLFWNHDRNILFISFPITLIALLTPYIVYLEKKDEEIKKIDDFIQLEIPDIVTKQTKIDSLKNKFDKGGVENLNQDEKKYVFNRLLDRDLIMDDYCYNKK
jgi:hypothetical protein